MIGNMAGSRAYDDLVARVVAWHNRNPFARRISPANVVSVGLVSFPFWAAGSGPARGATKSSSGADGVSASAEAVAAAVAAMPAAREATPGPDGADAHAAEPAADGAPGEASPSAPEDGATDASHAGAPDSPHEPPHDPPREPPHEGAPADATAGGSRLRDRARARAASAGPAAPATAAAPARSTLQAAPGRGRKGWRVAFDENLLDPHTPSQVARWALRHGSSRRPGPADAPARDLEPRVAGGRGDELARLWVYTAAVDLGAQRVRVIVSPLNTRHVLGPRITGLGRIGALAGTLAAGAAAGAIWLPSLRGGGTPVAATKPTVAPTEATPTGAAAVAPTVTAMAHPASAPAVDHGAGADPHAHAAVAATPHGSAPEAATPAASVSATATPPSSSPASLPPEGDLHVAEAPGPASAQVRSSPLRRIVPALSDDVRRAAREASEAAREERAGRRPTAAAPAPAGASLHAAEAHAGPAHAPATRDDGDGARAPAPATAGARAAAPATARVAAAPPATAWAVSTRNLRTRFESEQMLAALRDVAYRSGHGGELKLEVMPAGDDWRAVGWPFATRAEAERLREALAARGLKAEVVQF